MRNCLEPAFGRRTSPIVVIRRICQNEDETFGRDTRVFQRCRRTRNVGLNNGSAIGEAVTLNVAMRQCGQVRVALYEHDLRSRASDGNAKTDDAYAAPTSRIGPAFAVSGAMRAARSTASVPAR